MEKAMKESIANRLQFLETALALQNKLQEQYRLQGNQIAQNQREVAIHWIESEISFLKSLERFS